jgi:hypothetical protein
VRGTEQPVEKVGAELKNEAGMERVFQQAGKFCELRMYGVLGSPVGRAIFAYLSIRMVFYPPS